MSDPATAAAGALVPGFANDSRGAGRLGVIVPMSNTNLEPDFAMLRPPGVSLHFMRAGGYDLDAIPDSSQMRGFAEASLAEVLPPLCAARPDVVVYGCTSATLAHGPQYDRAFSQRLAATAGVPAVTAAGALVDALKRRGISRVGLCSPYTRELNQEAAGFLEACGIEVCHTAYVGTDLGNYGQGELTPEAVLALGCEADHRHAEAIVLSCTDMRAVEVLDALQQRLGKPALASNQALMEAAVRHLPPAAGRVG